MVTFITAMSAGQPVVTNQVPNLMMTNPNVNATNLSIVNTSTNQGSSCHPICHEWAWFRLEGCYGCSLGLALVECRLIALIIHQELGVMPLWIQQLNYCDVRIEFDVEADVQWVAQKLLRMEWLKGSHVTLSVPVVMR